MVFARAYSCVIIKTYEYALFLLYVYVILFINECGHIGFLIKLAIDEIIL